MEANENTTCSSLNNVFRPVNALLSHANSGVFLSLAWEGMGVFADAGLRMCFPESPAASGAGEGPRAAGEPEESKQVQEMVIEAKVADVLIKVTGVGGGADLWQSLGEKAADADTNALRVVQQLLGYMVR